MSADDVLPRRPAEDVDLQHGYTLFEVNALSMWAVTRDSYHRFTRFDDRLEVAWHAIIEHIYSSPEPPEKREVIKAGWRAISDQESKEKRFHGVDGRNPEAPASKPHDEERRKGFERYWWSASEPAPGPEDRVTDDVALAQILPRMRPPDRELLTAMAEHDDYGLAAEALGKSRHSFATEIGRARRAFRKLWHEGETPSGPWGADRRPRTGDRWRPSVTYRLIVRRRRLAFVPETDDRTTK
jgi:hypothetical protein